MCRVDVVKVEAATLTEDPVFSVLWHSPDRADTVLALTNTSWTTQRVHLCAERLGMPIPRELEDLPSGQRHAFDGGGAPLVLTAYQVAWLRVPAPELGS